MIGHFRVGSRFFSARFSILLGVIAVVLLTAVFFSNSTMMRVGFCWKRLRCFSSPTTFGTNDFLGV